MRTNNARAIAGRIVITPTRPDNTVNAMQTATFKRKIIAEATADGTLRDLHWCIEFRAPADALPPEIRPDGALAGPVVLIAAHPGKWIPLIPVAPDPVASREYAELLIGLIASKNRGRRFEYNPALITIDILRDSSYSVNGQRRRYRWYEWGERIPVFDEVCATCGGVGACACSDERLALVCGGGRTHITHGGEKALCGRSVAARWAVPVTSWERRRWGGLDLCGNCRRVWERGRE